jgi:ubiquinone biosynthesis protein
MTSSPPAPIRDLRRASEIVRTLAKHGFAALLRRDRLEDVEVPPDAVPAPQDGVAVAERVRKLLEELGPTFIKMGQILSTRPDFVPGPMLSALKTLQDDAPKLTLAEVRSMIEAELGKPADQVFASFDPEPLATASIAQVHRARLLVDGVERDVVVKVQRPGIKERMLADLSLLRWLSRALEGTIEEVSAYEPTQIVDQFERALKEELDFRHELKNILRARANFAAHEALLQVPEPFPQASAERVLVMERLTGIKVSATKGKKEYDPETLLHRIIEITYKQVFEDGFFHGDPHPGNILVQPDGRIGMIDYGLWGRLTEAQQETLVELLLAITLKSPSTMTRLALRVGQPPAGFDRARFEDEIRELLDRYVGVPLEGLSAGNLIGDAVDVIRRHRIRIPPEFAVLARATATLEGVLREIYPNFDFQRIVLPYVKRLLSRRFDVARMGPELMSLLLGVRGFVNDVPGQIDQLLRDLSTGRFRVSIDPESLRGLETAERVQSLRQALTGLAAVAFLSAAVTSLDPTPLIAWELPIVPVVAVALGALLVWGLILTFVFPHGLRRIRLGALLGRRG